MTRMNKSRTLWAALAVICLLAFLLPLTVQAATLRVGSQGDEVKTLQTKLKRWGYYSGEIDGIFGSNLTYLKPELRNRPWFHEVDVSKYIAYFISALNHDVSISSLLDPHSKIEALLKKRALERAKYADEQLSL